MSGWPSGECGQRMRRSAAPSPPLRACQPQKKVYRSSCQRLPAVATTAFTDFSHFRTVQRGRSTMQIYIYIHFPFWSALTSQSKDKNSLHALNERSSKCIRPKEVYSAEATQRNEKVPKTNKNKKEGKRRERMQAEEREKCRGLCVS